MFLAMCLMELVVIVISAIISFAVIKYQNKLFFKALDERLEKLEKRASKGEDENFFHKA